MRDAARFWDKRAGKYAQRPVADPDTYGKKLAITRNCFRPDSEVLEFGCGTGSTALAHAPYVKHILATDISSEMISIARAKAEAGRIENVTFETRSADHSDIPGCRYDVVLAHNVLHLLEDMPAAILEAHRLLKPGGAFVSSTACVGDMAWYFRLFAAVACSLRLIPPVNVFTQARLRQSLSEAGFVIDREWLPKKNAATFIVAIKRASALPGSQGAE
jgi:ubiquinone/menaquinone biosynthesis C-methylase UbiE